MFTGTVMENIRYGKLDATDEECIAAAKLANADGFIRMLPNGYDTVLSGDGSGLSQGQRQLISIARAAVADPPVMILDEATSSIDTRTEAIVQLSLIHISEPTRRTPISYAVFCLKKKIRGCLLYTLILFWRQISLL